jgi:hypothetical protein
VEVATPNPRPFKDSMSEWGGGIFVAEENPPKDSRAGLENTRQIAGRTGRQQRTLRLWQYRRSRPPEGSLFYPARLIDSDQNIYRTTSLTEPNQSNRLHLISHEKNSCF